MKKSLIIATLVLNLLAISALGDDVILKCRKMVGKSVITTMLLKDNSKQDEFKYSILEDISGFNRETNKETKAVRFIATDMTCSSTPRLGNITFTCSGPSQNPNTKSPTVREYTLSRSESPRGYSLSYSEPELSTGVDREPEGPDSVGTCRM